MKTTALIAGIVAAALATVAVQANAQPYPADTAARIEAIPIQSLTVSDAQFLAGNNYGAPTTIAGVLRVAQGEGPRPLVIMMAGSGGFTAGYEDFGDELLQMGISTLLVDSYAGRGIVSTGADQSQIPVLAQIIDLFATLDAVADHPRVDTSRIAVIGFSRGAIVSLYGAMTRFQDMWNHSGIDPVAYVSYWTPCWTNYIGDTDMVDHPIRLFQGTADDVTPIAPCRSYVERLQAAGADVELIEFEGAHHAFTARDLPIDPPLVLPRPVFQGLGNCLFREESVGVVVNTNTGEPFSWADDCFAGGSLAYSPDAAAESRAAVMALLSEVFRLE